jgi:hypothetical protein
VVFRAQKIALATTSLIVCPYSPCSILAVIGVARYLLNPVSLSQLSTEIKHSRGKRVHVDPLGSAKTASSEPGPVWNSIQSAITKTCFADVYEGLAEREGFEPPVPFRAHLISSQAPSAGLGHLSAPLQLLNRPTLLWQFLRYQVALQRAILNVPRNRYHLLIRVTS